MKIICLSKIAADERKNTKLVCNALLLDTQLICNDDDIGVKLRGKAMIKANGRLFKTTTAVNKYVKTFTFRENCLSIQIERIKHCKIKPDCNQINRLRQIGDKVS